MRDLAPEVRPTAGDEYELCPRLTEAAHNIDIGASPWGFRRAFAVTFWGLLAMSFGWASVEAFLERLS